MSNAIQFPWQQEFVLQHSQHLLNSFKHWMGRALLEADGSPLEMARALFEAPFVVVSHGTQSDPIFNYGNRKALELWELSWDDFTRMPSRKTVADVEQRDREQLLREAATRGFVTHYSGVRTSSTGRRFAIENVILWNVLDEQERYCGQAAMFAGWQFLDRAE